MKKIGILTFHRALNYGAVLQSYALSETIKNVNKDISVEIIDYRNDRIEERLSIFNKLQNKNFAKGFAGAILLIIKRSLFGRFLKEFIDMSTEVYDASTISNADNIYDVYVTGSDQIWNLSLTNNDLNYMLDFSNKEKYSYAASIGVSDFPQKFENNIISCLSKYTFLSVREKEAFNLLTSKLTNIDIRMDLDPTLLLDANKWDEIAHHRKTKDRYVLAYNVPQPDKMYFLANKIANEHNMSLKCIVSGCKTKFGKLLIPSVREFITLFRDAEYVVTNSFHGVVFSIIFHKKFVVELNPNKENANSRINTLLEVCGLEKRIFKDCINIEDEIDWNFVDSNISSLRNKSFDYLKNICK